MAATVEGATTGDCLISSNLENQNTNGSDLLYESEQNIRVNEEEFVGGGGDGGNVDTAILDCVEYDANEFETDKINLNNCYNDGSDSGVEIGANNIPANATCALLRALSSNSGGYSSSYGGLDCEQNCTGDIVSCNSSMISFCSDLGERKHLSSKKVNNDCCTSEGGSESSSITGGPVLQLRSKKKVTVNEAMTSSMHSMSKNVKRNSNDNTLKRSISASRTTGSAGQNKSMINSSNVTIRERARSRDKVPPKSPSVNRGIVTSKRPPKPDSFPIDIKDPASPAIQRIRGSRTPSITRIKTPSTPTIDDAKWKSNANIGGSTTPKTGRQSLSTETVAFKTKLGSIALDNNYTKNTTLDKFGTLPRRKKEKSVDDLKQIYRSPRSSSITRDTRVSSSTIVPNKKQNNITQGATTPSKSLPPYPKMSGSAKKQPSKTRIYHETSIQTVLTGKDVEDAFSGAVKSINVNAIETISVASQSDIRDKEFERIEAKLKKLTADYTAIQSTLSDKNQIISAMEQELIQEREDKLAAQKELHSNSERVLAMLESCHEHIPNAVPNNDSLLMLESKIIKSEHVREKQYSEILKWKQICANLQNDLEKSLRTQRNLIQQRDTIEQESIELQDFLQAEKVTLVDALREVEDELESEKENVLHKNITIERLQEECRNLVRIIEQRRQENMGLQSKFTSLETRNHEMLLQQNSAVSGASLALSGLGSRLESLVTQLITSYTISEQDLEDVIYHNEAYTNSSGEGSPEYEIACQNSLAAKSDGSLSPQRGHSFITAVINAIKNATSLTTTHKNVGDHSSITNHKLQISQSCDNNFEESDSTEMLDSETEPCLMMENVLEDVTMPDSHSHNLMSTSGLILSQIEIPSEMKRCGGESLHNLSQAIENRQQIELQSSIMAANRSANPQSNNLLLRQIFEQSVSDDVSGHESIADIPSIIEYCSPQSLVDQVIDVDNLVTKLLKVLRIIQMDNDNCIQQLICDKNKLQLNKEEMLEKMKETDELNYKLRDELKDATQNLMSKSTELQANKIEVQRNRIEIGRLNEDICNLSTLCSQNLSSSCTKKDQIIEVLKDWQQTGVLKEPEVINYILKECAEIPLMNDKLAEKGQEISNLINNKNIMAAGGHQAIYEAKRQYEAIDRALETLNGIQTIVNDCPALLKLQHDLEETNFQSVTLLSLSTALLPVKTTPPSPIKHSDLNANGHDNNNTNNGPNQNNSLQINGGDNPIDSIA